MNSYHVGAMGSAYPTGFNAKPRKAKEESDEKSTSPKNESLLGKDFKNEHFNGWGVAGLTGVGALAGSSADGILLLDKTIKHIPNIEGDITQNKLIGFMEKTGSNKWAAITAGVALAGGLLWEKIRSDGAKKHNTELIDKLRTEENNS